MMSKDNKAAQNKRGEDEAMERETQEPEKTADLSEQTEGAEKAAAENAEKPPEANEWKTKYDELYDKYLRTLAEYDNYKKRTQKEKDELFSFAVADTLEKLLPVLDNLERAADAAETTEDKESLCNGVKMVLKQFGETLEKMGVTPIEAVGKEFDPNLHNAVMHMEDETQGTNVVVEEFQKGYKHKERIIRHSMVKVAN